LPHYIFYEQSIGCIFCGLAGIDAIPEQAEQYIAQIERVTDQSWIANFGMSAAQFDAERYGLYLVLYEKKYAAEKMKVAETVKDFFLRQRNLWIYSAFLQYYRALSGICNLKLAKEYHAADSKSSMHAFYKNSFYYRAFESIPFNSNIWGESILFREIETRQ